MQVRNTLSLGYAVWFNHLPHMGMKIADWNGRTAQFVGAKPYVRTNGKRSYILTWKRPNGTTGTSGLKSKGIQWGNDYGQ